MNIPKKIYAFSIIVVTVGTIVFLVNRNNKASDGVEESALNSPSSSPEQTPVPTQLPKATAYLPKPSSGIVVTETMSYESWIKWLDPLNRRLVLDKDCTSIAPSQVDYPNDVEVMIDNTASGKSRILNIAGREYSLDANGWILTTLHSDKLPAQLSVYCGSMELGRLDLVAK